MTNLCGNDGFFWKWGIVLNWCFCVVQTFFVELTDFRGWKKLLLRATDVLEWHVCGTERTVYFMKNFIYTFMTKNDPELHKYVASLDRIKLAFDKSLGLKKVQTSAEKVILKIFIHFVWIRPVFADNFFQLAREFEIKVVEIGKKIAWHAVRYYVRLFKKWWGKSFDWKLVSFSLSGFRS